MTYTLVKYGKRECNIDNYLLRKLLAVRKLIRKNWDCVILVDGIERGGKSTLAMTMGWFLSRGTLTLNNISSDSEDAARKCENLPKKSVLILDEGSLVFSSKDTMKSEQRKLIKILNVIGQKNMIFIIVLPSFFDLNRFVAINRSRFLCHVYTGKRLERGKFCYFSEKRKKKLYEYGKKHYNSYRYPKANFVSSFPNFFPFDDYTEYEKIKSKSLSDAFHNEKKSVNDLKEEYKEHLRKQDEKKNKNLFIANYLRACEDNGIKYKQRDIAKKYGCSQQQITIILRQLREGGLITTKN